MKIGLSYAVIYPRTASRASKVTSQLVGRGVTTSVLYMRKFGPYMYGTPYTLAVHDVVGVRPAGGCSGAITFATPGTGRVDRADIPSGDQPVRCVAGGRHAVVHGAAALPHQR